MPESMLDPLAIANLRTISPDDGGEFIRELVDIFLADTPMRIAEIERALATDDSRELTRAAHSIRGSSGNFGASQLSALAGDIETRGKSGDFASVRVSLPALQAEFARLQPAFAQLRLGT